VVKTVRPVRTYNSLDTKRAKQRQAGQTLPQKPHPMPPQGSAKQREAARSSAKQREAARSSAKQREAPRSAEPWAVVEVEAEGTMGTLNF